MRTPIDRRTVSGLVLALALGAVLLLPSGTPHAAPHAGPSPLHVTGYAYGSSSAATVRRNAPGIDTLTLSASMLNARGTGFSRPKAALRARAAQAQALGLRTELLVNNWSNPKERFDARAAQRLLRHPSRHAAAADQLARYLSAGGFNGINVDLEMLSAADADGLVAFLSTLRAALPEDASISIDVGANTSLRGYRAAGFRLGAIADMVDLVQVMTYDQHGPAWSGPGPIGSLGWQRAAIRASKRAVPAEQLDLGVAGYGYLWRADGTGRMLTVAQARRIAARDGVAPRWRRAAGEWRVPLSRGRTVWYSDARSLSKRKRLAAELGVHGVAIWRVGSADTITR